MTPIYTVGPAIAMVLIVLIIYWWCREFVFLMCLSDADMPGRYDKILWFVVFFLLNVFAPPLFYLWRRAYLETKRD